MGETPKPPPQAFSGWQPPRLSTAPTPMPQSSPIPPPAPVATAPTILFAGIVSGAMAYTIQIFAQAHTPPAEAALILALEGVFAAPTANLTSDGTQRADDQNASIAAATRNIAVVP